MFAAVEPPMLRTHVSPGWWLGALCMLACVPSCNGARRPPDSEPRPGSASGSAPPADARSEPIRRDASIQSVLDTLDPPYPPPRPLSRKHRRGDCQTKYAPRPDRDPNPMCRVEGGTFMFGGGMYLVNEADGQREVQRPATKTTVRSFYIDQFEVTAAQAATFLNAHGNVCDGGIDSAAIKKQDPRPIPCVWIELRSSDIEEKEGRFVARRGQEQWPETSFTWEGALRYCAWAGKRIPSSSQWEYAAGHDPDSNRDLLYPWGDSWIPHAAACNDPVCDQRPASRVSPNVDPLPVGTFDGTRGRADGSSPWGAHDMAGGMEELVFECASPDETCSTGTACACKVLTTSNFAASDLGRLRIDHRVDDTRLGFGFVGVRCVTSGAPIDRGH